MAFRRKKGTFRRSSGRPLAKVRRTWNTNIRASWCNPYLVEIADCNDGRSGTSVIFQLVNQVILEDQFSDACSVKRIVGDLFFYPNYETPPPGPEIIGAYVGLSYWQAFVGLRKRDINAQGATTAFSPLDDDDDFGDAKWLRTWQHHSQPGGVLTVANASHNAAYPVYKPDVHTFVVPGTTTCNAFTGGTGTFCIETTGTVDCEECDHTSQDFGASAHEPRVWHWHIDLKRKRGMFLRENEELVLQFDFAHPFISTFLANGPRFSVFGGVKTLLQY